MTAVVPPDQTEQRTAQFGDGHVAGYSFGPVTVDVDTDTADTHRWLKEFLTPAVDVTAFGHGEVAIRLTCSHEEFDAFDRRSAFATRLIPCFALDSRLVMLPGWDDGKTTVLADKNHGCFYRIHGRLVDIVGRPEVRRARLGLMRVVRETLTARWLARGRLLDLHAAAFEADQRAVLIAGPKYSGKTTLLCYALASRRARLIANDRVFVDVDQDPGDVYGIPTLVSIRPDTLRLFPDLQGGRFGRPVFFHTGEQEIQREGAARDGNVRSLSPTQLAERLGSSSVRGAPLAAVVFPEIAADTDTWTVDALSATDGLALLHTCFYGVQRDGATRTILEELAGSLPSRVEPDAMASRLAEKVRFFRCRLGPRAYERSADDWLRALALDAAGDTIQQ